MSKCHRCGTLLVDFQSIRELTCPDCRAEEIQNDMAVGYKGR